MKSITDRIRQIRFYLAGILAFTVLLAVSACGTVTVPAATPTPLPPDSPRGLGLLSERDLRFRSLLPGRLVHHHRVGLALADRSGVPLGYELSSRNGWMWIRGRVLRIASARRRKDTPPDPSPRRPARSTAWSFLCKAGRMPGRAISTPGPVTRRRGMAYASALTGVLHSTNPAMYPTPPPEYDPAGEAAVFDEIVATFRWLEEATPEPTATIPPGWVCYQNALYAFEVCYPADATISEEAADHIRINLTIAPGTNLSEKWMDVDGRNTPPDCESPQASGYDPSAINSHTRTIAGLEFLVQAASEGAAGNIYQWTGYSTSPRRRVRQPDRHPAFAPAGQLLHPARGIRQGRRERGARTDRQHLPLAGRGDPHPAGGQLTVRDLHRQHQLPPRGEHRP